MVSTADIKALAERIGTEFRPERIVLFGSRAKGTSRPDSDVDLLVISEFDGNEIDEAVRILTKVRPDFAVDLIVRRPRDVEWRYRYGDALMHEIFRHGQLMYEAAA